MTQIMLDAAAARKFLDLQTEADLCDPSGKVLGRFVPLIDMSEWEPLTPEVSEEELDRLVHEARREVLRARGI